MATPNIVPRADQEGGLGTAAKGWGKLFIENAAAGGTAAATISNLDVDKVALDINANNTTANVVDITAGALNGGSSIYLNTLNGQNDIKLVSSADATDYFTIATGAIGATTLTTVDTTVGATAHFAVVADGNVDVDGLVVTLDAATSIELEGTTNVTGALETNAALTADNIVCTNAATFGGGTGSTGTTITTAGVITTDGAISSTASAVTGLNYRTIYVDAGGMVPAVTNGAIASTEEMHATNFTTLDYLTFLTSTEQYADFKLVMPEQYDNGVIKAKFYWKPADAEASVSVVWGIKAYAATDSDALTGASGVWGTEQVIEDVSLNTVDDLHISATTPAITIAGTPAEGKLVFVRVFRKVAASADDYADSAELLGLNIQYKESATASSAW